MTEEEIRQTSPFDDVLSKYDGLLEPNKRKVEGVQFYVVDLPKMYSQQKENTALVIIGGNAFMLASDNLDFSELDPRELVDLDFKSTSSDTHSDFAYVDANDFGVRSESKPAKQKIGVQKIYTDARDGIDELDRKLSHSREYYKGQGKI